MQRHRGFTLIEVLLAVSLVAIIMAMAYGGFRASVRATRSGEAVIEQTNRLRVVQQFVRRQLMQTRSLVIEQMEDGQAIRFEGDRDFVRFVAPLPGYLSYGGPYVQQLSLERGEDGQELVFYYAMLNGYEDGALEATTDGVVLMEGLEDAEFIFLDVDERGEETFWSDFWEYPERLPLAVGLLADLNSERGLAWPDLIAPVMIDSSHTQRDRTIRRASDMILQRSRGSDRGRR
ncbi:MAG: prepilin-type N-terminal cleavage/methylation domain-containing protein [Gammaproteobacteria bacterium]|nr:prepilin-type N-terminal cleavage/methylation domain-containing protein [Gammaproteobacteria bacterium]